MSPDVLEFIAPLIALLGTGALILVGMNMRLKAKQMGGRSPEDLDRLTEAVEDLYEQNRMLRDEVTDLQERIDFHERVLVEGGKPEPADTPL